MKENVNKLHAISNKSVRTVIGLMSGTSVDGLDVALCSFEGSGLNTKFSLLHFETVAFDVEMKAEIKSVFSKKQIDFEKLTLLNPWIALQHAAIINLLLKKWGLKNEEVDLMASHGQTVYHAPKHLHRQNKFGNATLQIGDGDHLAVATGIITLSDFRQKHIAAGGEGAPLAVYGDYLLFSKKGEDRLLLNIGGIANFTVLPGNMKLQEVICTDVGPGNSMLDTFMQQQFPGTYFDKDAAVAAAGKINTDLLTALKEDVFFVQPFPKTTGPELFNLDYLDKAKQKTNTQSISANDTMATLTKFSADMIVVAIKNSLLGKTGLKIFSSGGGMHNPLLMAHIKEQLPNCSFHTTSELGIDPDAKEALLFAVLANECVCGDPSTFGENSTAYPTVSMGKISFPS